MKTATKFQSKSVTSMIAGVVILGWAGNVGAQTRGAGPNISGPTSEPLTANVDYADLNLDNPRGAKILYGRLQNAARKVCVPFESQQIHALMLWQTCYDQALDFAVRQVNKAAVTELYRHSIDHSPIG